MADPIPDSILTKTKKLLGITESDTSFDIDVITHINSVFSTLLELGVGPEQGYSIEDKEALWSDFIPDDKPVLNQAKSYMYLRVKLLFDPPTSSFAIDSMNRQAKEMEWRLETHSPAPVYGTVET